MAGKNISPFKTEAGKKCLTGVRSYAIIIWQLPKTVGAVKRKDKTPTEGS